MHAYTAQKKGKQGSGDSTFTAYASLRFAAFGTGKCLVTHFCAALTTKRHNILPKIPRLL